jgi:hypothetical protein
MTGEKDLEKILASLSAELMDGEYVFCTFQNAQYGDYSDLEPVAAINESEGLTLIIPKRKADERSYSYESTFRRVTLRIHSSLDAVGLTAAFSSKLTEHGISANVIAGFYHDHIFVQSEFAGRAMKALNEFAR